MNDVARPTVFISYAWSDEITALAVDQWLRDQGARVLIDRRDFIPGSDLESEIVRCLTAAGKVVCIYSANFANRPYPELERRIAAALERVGGRGQSHSERKLLYFCIDDTPLPTEALPRLAIGAANLSFDEACKELWRSILGAVAPPQQFDLERFRDSPPWAKEDKKRVFDLGKDSADIERFYRKL